MVQLRNTESKLVRQIKFSQIRIFKRISPLFVLSPVPVDLLLVSSIRFGRGEAGMDWLGLVDQIFIRNVKIVKWEA